MSAQSESAPGPPGAPVPVVFLSGAGLPAWIWDDVRAGLPENGETIVVRYPRGTDVTLADYADAVRTQAPWPTFAVVAHSSGGVVATEVLTRHIGRVAGILGVTAVFPRAGHSFLRTMPLPARFVVGAMMRVAGTRPPAKAVRAGLAAGLPEATADRLVADFDPEPAGLYRDACSARHLPAVRGYLHTTEDEELTEAIQRASAEVLQATWIEEVPTGHLPMLQDPARVGQAVRRLLTEISHCPARRGDVPTRARRGEGR